MIDYEKLQKLVKEKCNHEWITGRYVVKHCRKCGEVSECEHEPYMTMPTLNDDNNVSKCKKCGEFYK